MKFVKVQSHKDLESYCNIWLPVWIESGYELESYITKGIERFIVYTNTSEKFGCFELNPYYFDCSPVNEAFPFHHFPILKNKRVVELEKLVIAKTQQGSIKRLLEVFQFFTAYIITERRYDYMIALINPELFHVLTTRFNLPLIKLEGKMNSDRNYFPILLEVKALEETVFGQKALNKYALAV
ncbi:hypothetical protein R4Z09_26085 [Niallia oryzisoli]|uniref:Uncharacterized protein n=1 Tax=Niallia oryzisoli TaxID=1737571 RepID=A0ABZ2CFV5_9BACI